MCECGSVIVIRRFIRKGLPLSCAVTYMLASPIVSPIVALSTFAAFRGKDPWHMMSLRLAFGYRIAIAAGFIVSRLPASEILQPGLIADLPAEPLRLPVRRRADRSECRASATSPISRGGRLRPQDPLACNPRPLIFSMSPSSSSSASPSPASSIPSVQQQIIEPFATNSLLAIVA